MAGGRDRAARRDLRDGDRAGPRVCPTSSAAAAQQLALRLADELGVVGVLAVELFETDRRASCWSTSWRCGRTTPGTGPWTARRTSQFEQHLRAVLDYPLGDTAPVAPVTVMANVLGAAADAGDDASTSGCTTCSPAIPTPRCTCTARASGRAARSATSTSSATTSTGVGEAARTGRKRGTLVVARANGPTDGIRMSEHRAPKSPGRRDHGQRQRLVGDGRRRRGAGRVRRPVRGRRGLGAPHPAADARLRPRRRRPRHRGDHRRRRWRRAPARAWSPRPHRCR